MLKSLSKSNHNLKGLKNNKLMLLLCNYNQMNLVMMLIRAKKTSKAK